MKFMLQTSGAVFAISKSVRPLWNRTLPVSRRPALRLALNLILIMLSYYASHGRVTCEALRPQRPETAAQCRVVSVMSRTLQVWEEVPPHVGGRADLKSGVLQDTLQDMGQSVDGLQPLFEVVDPSWMWAEVDIPERALARQKVGKPLGLRT